MNHNAEFRRCLETCDVPGIRRLWKFVQPNLPQPTSDREALVSIHIARTQAQSVPRKLRYYSHRWLTDEGYPSMLPDYLKSKAERVYPRIVEGVGIAVRGQSTLGQMAAPIIRKVMEEVVLDAYAGSKEVDPVQLKGRMLEAREQTYKKLFG